MTLLRRYLWVVAFAFWQGGFTFYAGVVVPTGSKVLGDHTAQGFITREVAAWLNLTAAAALVVMAWDTVAERGWRMRGGVWLLMAAGVVVTVILHPRLDALLDVDDQSVRDRVAFRAGHRVYLWAVTGQWAVSLVYLAFTLMAWRKSDSSE